MITKKLALLPLILTLLAVTGCKEQSDKEAQSEARQVATRSVVTFINENADSLAPKIIQLIKAEGLVASGSPDQAAVTNWLKSVKASYLAPYGHGKSMDYFHFNTGAIKLGDSVELTSPARLDISCLVPIDDKNVVSSQGRVKIQLLMQVPMQGRPNVSSVVKKPLN